MARGGFDFSEFRKLYQGFQEISTEFESFLEDFLLKQALIALRLVRPRTPVDTGTLRRMWQISNVEVSGNTLQVYLINPMEYASYMESGFTYNTKSGTKRFPGFHMAELAILQVRQQMPAKFESAFIGWLRTKGWG